MKGARGHYIIQEVNVHVLGERIEEEIEEEAGTIIIRRAPCPSSTTAVLLLCVYRQKPPSSSDEERTVSRRAVVFIRTASRKNPGEALQETIVGGRDVPSVDDAEVRATGTRSTMPRIAVQLSDRPVQHAVLARLDETRGNQ